MLKLSPDKFYTFSEKLFERQKEFFDVSVVNETRNDTYKRLAKIAGEVGVDEGKVFELLKISDKPGEDGSLNSGNEVTDSVKLQVKANRLVGVHVTPVRQVTLFFSKLDSHMQRLLRFAGLEADNVTDGCV